MDNFEVFLRVCLLGFSLILTLVSLVSLLRARNMRLFFAFSAFLVFTLEGVLLVAGIVSENVRTAAGVEVLIAMNLLAVVCLYGSVAK